MKVTAVFHGIIAEWVGAARDVFFLPENARLADLLAAIRSKYGPSMPPQLWDEEHRRFAKQVVAFREGRVRLDPAHPLRESDDIRFLLMIGGG